jgi:hypothetical protein
MKIHCVSNSTSYTQWPRKRRHSYKGLWSYIEPYHGELLYFPLFNRPLKRTPEVIRTISVVPHVCFPGCLMYFSESVANNLRNLIQLPLIRCNWNLGYEVDMTEEGVIERSKGFSVLDESFSEHLSRITRPVSQADKTFDYYTLGIPVFDVPKSVDFDVSMFDSDIAVADMFPIFRHSSTIDRLSEVGLGAFNFLFLMTETVYEHFSPYVGDADEFNHVELKV